MNNNKLSNRSLSDIDRESLIHPFTHLKDFAAGTIMQPKIITGGEGVYIRRSDGKSYLDAFAGLYCVNIGYGRPEMAQAIYEQANKLAYYHAYAGHSNEPAVLLAQKILQMAPEGMSKVLFGLGGSDANDTQVKLVWYYNNVLGRPAKKKIISRHRGYHGGTMMSGSLTGLPVYHKAFDLPIARVLHTTAPHYYWGAREGMTEQQFSQQCAQDLEDLILEEGPDTVAAFIGEPVLGTGGLIPPPEGYWECIQQVLQKYDVLLIVDEVICGFGRVGTPFGSDLYGIKPDLMTIAKGLTSGYLPLSACVISERVWRVLEHGSDELGPFAHGLTYTAHPTSAAAGLKNLEIIENEGLIENARQVGAHFQQGMREAIAHLPYVGEVRGVGLLGAVEFVADKDSKKRFDAGKAIGGKLAADCLEKGIICRAMPHGDILGFAPPLVINKREVDKIIDVVTTCIKNMQG